MSTEHGKAPVLILAVGNPSRGDDALGPLLATRLQEWLGLQHADLQRDVEVITDQQLLVEHVLDLQDRACVLFIDATAQGEAAVSLVAVTPLARPVPVSTHSSSPTQLLSLYQQLLHAAPPPAHLLTLRGHGFELGAPLSEAAQATVPQAWSCLQAWLSDARAILIRS